MLFFHSKPLFIDIWNIYFHSSLLSSTKPSNSSHPEHHRRHWHLSLCFFLYILFYDISVFHFPMNFFSSPSQHQPKKHPSRYYVIVIIFWFWFEFLILFWLAKLTQKTKNINLGQNLLACWVIIGWFPFPNEHFPPLLCFFTWVWFGAQSRTANVTLIRKLTSTREVKLRPLDCNKSGQFRSRAWRNDRRNATAIHGNSKLFVKFTFLPFLRSFSTRIFIEFCLLISPEVVGCHLMVQRFNLIKWGVLVEIWIKWQLKEWN